MTRRTLAGLALAAVACGAPQLETRTFQLQHMETYEVDPLLRPYPSASWTFARGAVTVRETPDNLDKIARLLAEHDRPRPSVRLYFQIIGADGFANRDTAIREVETELRRLFRFRGYRLLAEGVLGGVAFGEPVTPITQMLAGPGGPYSISVRILDVRGAGDSGSVRLVASLVVHRVGASPVLETQVALRPGQTAVLGNAQLDVQGGTLILAVKPELLAN
jgi:hypothetical protein